MITPQPLTDKPEDIAHDVAAVARISAVPSLLKLICQQTGMGFAAVARVTDGTWTACAVQDNIAFGLKAGGALPVNTTLCIEAKAARQPIVFDHASENPQFRDHHTPRMYNIESYISVPIIRPNGQYFGNLCAIDPHPHAVSDPRTVSMFTSFADLIALQLDTEEQHDQADAALATERETGDLREQFIAVLGHDLRNPLSSVSAGAELLTRRTEDPGLVRIGKRIQASALRMSRLIDDVLDFARGRLGSGIPVGSGGIPDLALALRQVVRELQTAHPERNIVAEINIDAPVQGDRARLQQLLSNLLGNALAHGAEDKPITVTAEFGGSGEVVLSVANHGEPIDPAHLDHLFKPYWRPATSKPGGGLGLGLYICAEIVKAHGGQLTVSSTVEDGTFFVARLPITGGEQSA